MLKSSRCCRIFSSSDIGDPHSYHREKCSPYDIPSTAKQQQAGWLTPSSTTHTTTVCPLQMPPRYEIQDSSTRNKNGPLKREPTCKIRVLIVDRSQMRFLTHSLKISRENSSEKGFNADEDRVFRNATSQPFLTRNLSSR